MHFDIITIFPEIFESYFNESILKRAQKSGLIKIKTHNLRNWTIDKHKTTDDTPYGGGAGMVMKVEPIYRAVQAIISETLSSFDSSDKTPNYKPQIPNKIPASTRGDDRSSTRGGQNKKSKKNIRVILFSAKGKKYTQADARRLAKYDNLILVCGRYEGVDERVAAHIADEEISIGDYVMTGGEIPAMVVVDSVARLMSGVLGNEESSQKESHKEAGYLEHPQYTKPEEFMSWKVPKILLGGNHNEIERWRKEKSQKE